MNSFQLRHRINIFPNAVAKIIATYAIPKAYDAFVDSGIELDNENDDIHTMPSVVVRDTFDDDFYFTTQTLFFT